LDHVEDMDAERAGSQCTLCYSYRKLLRDALVLLNPMEATK
jgi:hypothetical protein